MKQTERLTSAQSKKKGHFPIQNEKQFAISQQQDVQIRQNYANYANSQQQRHIHNRQQQTNQPPQNNSPLIHDATNRSDTPQSKSLATNQNTSSRSRKVTITYKIDSTKKAPQKKQKHIHNQQQQTNQPPQNNSPQFHDATNRSDSPQIKSLATNRNTSSRPRKPTKTYKIDRTKRASRKKQQQRTVKASKQHDFQMICWNVDGGMNVESNKHHQIVHEIKQFNPTILCVQEAVGTKGKGYIKRNKSCCGNIPKMKLVNVDKYAVTAIYIHHKVSDYVTLNFPSHLFEQYDPKDKIHATGIVIFMKQSIRNRNSIIFLNVYRSPGVTAAPIKHVSKLINWIKEFVEDQSPNIILAGDLNFWSELNGSDPKKRRKYRRKFEDGDNLIDALQQQKMSLYSNQQPTMWKKQNDDIITEYSVDSLWITNNLKQHVNISANFECSIKVSDHYPHKVSIKRINALQAPKTHRTEWKINETTSDDWIRFEESVNKQCVELHEQIKERMMKPTTRTKTIIDASIKTIQQILLNSATECIGKKVIYQNHKCYINKEIKRIIDELRKEKKKLKCILNRERKLKKNHGCLMNELILKRDIGIKAFHRLKAFKTRERYKQKIIRQARRKWINSKIEKLTSKKDKKWYETLNEVENIAYGKHKHIGHIIKPSIAIYPPDKRESPQIKSLATNRISSQKTNQRRITLKDYTKNDKETAEEVNKYFNTIGTEANPNYCNTMKNRKTVRRLDKPFDFDPAAHPTHQDELEKLTAPFKFNELKFHVHKLKNNKKFGIDDIHTSFVKRGLTAICHVLLMVFNYWKDSGEVTDGLNERLIIPLLKPGKPHNVVKGLRPISIENIIWKLYQMMVEYRIARYVTNLGIISKNQFASKKGSSSEDCLIDIVTSIDEALNKHQPVHMAGFDSSDAYDSMMDLILEDKFKYHAGFNGKGVVMVKSLLKDRTSRCMINGTKSSLIRTQSGPFQGAPPSGLLWIIYINPLIMKIDKCSKNHVVKIQIKSFMDDITIFTQFLTTYLKNQIPSSVQFMAGKLFQESINFIVYYLKVNNIPINAGKTQIMTITKQKNQKFDDFNSGDDLIKSDSLMNETDHMLPFKTQEFSVDGKDCNKKKEITILGLSLVENWNFANQISKIITRMKQVRGRCWSLLKSNKNSINMEAIKEILISTSFQLLNYAGSIFLHKGEELNQMRVEYNNSIRMLSSKCRTVPVAAMLNFHGLKSFEYHVQVIGAKALSKFIRCPDNNALQIKKQSFIRDYKNWKDTLNINGKWLKVNDGNVSKYFPKDKKNDMVWNWYSAARFLGSTDCLFLQDDNFLKRIDQKFIPEPLPDFIQFQDFNEPWNDKNMKKNGIYYFLDGSVYYKSKNPKLHNHGFGGGAVTIYKNKKLFKKMIYPISTRTHINTMELAMFYQSFTNIIKRTDSTNSEPIRFIPPTPVSMNTKIDSKNSVIMDLIRDDLIYSEFNFHDFICGESDSICGEHDSVWEHMEIDASHVEEEEIHVISDSQNCIKLLKQDTYTEDEALIQIMQAISSVFKAKPITNKRIIIHWVESHEESKLNDEVDFWAKIAAQRMMYQEQNLHANSQHINQHISYQTVKQELKSKALQNECDMWTTYKESRQHKWSNHYYKWNVSHDKRYSKELVHLSKLENDLRIMLYTNHFPVNKFWHEKLNMEHISPLCNDPQCMREQTEESLFHFLIECPQYEQDRKILMQNVQDLYKKHNMMNIQDNKVLFNTNKHDQRYLQQFIFPSKQICLDLRMRILKAVIKFIISTDRIRNMYW